MFSPLPSFVDYFLIQTMEARDAALLVYMQRPVKSDYVGAEGINPRSLDREALGDSCLTHESCVTVKIISESASCATHHVLHGWYHVH